jgi:hypothetical protein
MANILSLSNTTGSPVTVPVAASPATIATYALGENNYQAIEFNVTILMVTAGTSTAQDVTFEFKNGATVMETIIKKSKAAVDDHLLHLSLMAKMNAKATITLTVKAAAADANTSVTVQNTYILGHY